MGVVVPRAATLGLLLLLISAAFASSGLETKTVEVTRDWIGNAEAPADSPGRVAAVRPTEPAADQSGPHLTARQTLHVGTYPVAPPPGAEAAAERAGDEIGINTAPDGKLLVSAGALNASRAPVPIPTSRPSPVPWATYTVEGVFQFEDRELDERGFTGVTWMAPIRDADVEFYDVDSGEVLGMGSTNETGYFRIAVSDSTIRNISSRVIATSRLRPGLFNITVAGLPRFGGQPYTLASPVYPNHSPETNISFRDRPVNATKDDLGSAFHIFDLAKSAQRYIENLTSRPPPVNLTVYWSRGYGEGKYYDTNGHIYLMGTTVDDDSYDDPVVLHEIGHYIAISYSADAGFYGPHGLAGTVDIRLSYTEGLGSYFMGAVRNFLNLTQPLIYIETNGSALNWFGFSLSYDTDTPSSYSDGEFQDWTSANEVAVAHALHDVVDGVDSRDGTPGVDDDPMDLPNLAGDRLVWDVLVSIRENATVFTKAITMETFYDQWLLAEPGYAAEFTQILLANGIEYTPDGYEVDDTPVAATSTSTDGSSYHHTFYPAEDDDWAVFIASGGVEYVIKTGNLLDGADTILELYDSDGTTLLATNGDRDASTVASLLDFRAPSTGPYYLRTFRNAETPTPIGEYGKYDVTVYVLPDPVITGVDPPSGRVQGGTPVVLTGSNFTAGALVRFGIYDAADVLVLDGNTISATTPANVPGSVDVTVINPPNADAIVPRGVLPGGYTYTGTPLPPVVRSISPDFGTTTVPTNVTVTGDFFLAGATLHFDAIPCAACSVLDPRTIVATVPPLPLAVYDVRVTNPDGKNDTLANGFESASYAFDSVPSSFDSGNPLSTSLSITDDFEIMDVYVYANITHPSVSWGVVRLELESPSGKVVMVFDRISVADPSGLTWRTRINSTFGYDEAPSEVLWQFRGERTAGLWTLRASAVVDSGSPSTLHSWGLYFFRYRHRDPSRVVLTAALYRNYVVGFDEATGTPLYRVRLHSEDPDYPVAYPIAVAVTRDQRHACGGGYSDYNGTRGGWTDSTVTCFETRTGKTIKTFFLSGNLGVDGIEASRDADRLVAATNEYLYVIDTTTLQLIGSLPTGFSAGAPPAHLGLTPDGLRAYVANEDGHHVLIVDLATMTVAGRIDLPGYAPLDVDISADGTFGLISSAGSPSVLHRFDPATDAITSPLPVAGLQPVQTVLTPDGSRAFYTFYQWYAGFGRTDMGSLATRMFNPHPESTTEALAMGRDGTLYVADWYIQRIWVYNASTEALAMTILVPDRVYPAGIDVADLVPKVALSASGGDGYVDLSWDTPASYGSALQGYVIYRGNESGEEVRYATVGVTNSYVDLSVSNGKTYYYQVGAVNGAGEGAPSNEAWATPDVSPPPPMSSMATADRTAADVGQSISFDCGATGGIPPYTYGWTFGDGGTGTGQTTVHAYATPGIMTATCTVTDSAFTVASASAAVTISPAPSVTVSVDHPDASPGTQLTFTASASGGPGTFTNYAWAFGDGSTGSGQTASHSYSQTGAFDASVVVTDPNGETAAGSVTVTISIVTITASVSPTSDLPGALFTFTAVATGGAGAPYTFLWRFGDGATSTGATATHSYSTPGNYTASVTATDSLGGSGTTELASAVTVRTPDTTPPTITHATPGSVVVGDDIHIAATVADADSPVQEVHLVYTSVGGTEQNVTMTLLDGEYVYVIPGQTSAGTVRYRIYAADASGNARLTQEYMVTVTGHSTAGALDTGLIGILVAILAASIATTAFALRRRRKGRGKNPPPSRPPPSRTEEGSPQAPPESESGSVDQSGALGGWSRRFHLAYRREGRSEPPRSRGGRTRRVARDAHRLRVNRELVGARLGILRRTSRGERMHGPGVIPILECVATPRHLALSRLTVRDALSLGLRTGRQLPSEICCEAFPARVNARIDCLVSGSTLNSSDPLKARIGKVTPLRTLVWKRVTDHGGSGS